MSQLKLLVAEHFNGEIWRMEIDHISHTLFAETRNNEDRKVSFAAISLESGKTFFKNYTVDESWLTGIETAYNSVLLLLIMKVPPARPIKVWPLLKQPPVNYFGITSIIHLTT
jgi:hypothetical protein